MVNSYNPTIISRLAQIYILIYLLTLDYFVIVKFITHHLHVLLKFMCKKSEHHIHHLEQNIRVNVDSLFKFHCSDCKFKKLRFTLQGFTLDFANPIHVTQIIILFTRNFV